MSSVWLLHTKLSRSRNRLDVYGADRADMETDLGITGDPLLRDVLGAWLVFLPITLRGESAATLELLYTLTQTGRSITGGLEYICYPTAITRLVAETMISPQRV